LFPGAGSSRYATGSYTSSLANHINDEVNKRNPEKCVSLWGFKPYALGSTVATVHENFTSLHQMGTLKFDRMQKFHCMKQMENMKIKTV